MSDDVTPLCLVINRLLSGDHSKAAVSGIERVLVEHFLEADFFDDLSEPLALYQPGGTSPYVNEVELEGLLRDFADCHNSVPEE